MRTPMRVTPWRTLSIALGNTIQIGALLGAVALAWYAGQEGVRGTRWILASRLLAYFSEHAFSHWLVGRALGIHFTGYGLHGTSHPQHYPPGIRYLFSRLPLLSARTDPASLDEATPRARAAMYAAGTVASVMANVAIPGYALRRDIPGARKLLVGASLWNVPLILSESLRPGGDLRRAWRELAKETLPVIFVRHPQKGGFGSDRHRTYPRST
jgi:hypothetical protein